MPLLTKVKQPIFISKRVASIWKLYTYHLWRQLMKYVFLVEMKNTNFVEYNGYLNIGQSIGDETDHISIVFNIFHIQDLGT